MSDRTWQRLFVFTFKALVAHRAFIMGVIVGMVIGFAVGWFWRCALP